MSFIRVDYVNGRWRPDLVKAHKVMAQLRDDAGIRGQRWPDHFNDYDRLLYVASQYDLGLETNGDKVLSMLEQFDKRLRGTWRSSYEQRVCWKPGPYAGWRLHKVVGTYDSIAELSGGSKPRLSDLAGAKFGDIYAVRYDIDGTIKRAFYMDNVVMRTSVPMKHLIDALHDAMLGAGEAMSLEEAKRVAERLRSELWGAFFPEACVKLALTAATQFVVNSRVINAFEGETELKESIRMAQEYDALRHS